jgi:uncharacterized membrane protein YeaQ/YmgE (transglycosylase-associated protein family)
LTKTNQKQQDAPLTTYTPGDEPQVSTRTPTPSSSTQPGSKPAAIKYHKETRMFSILWWIIVGLIAGFVTGKLMKGGGYGTVMDIVVGIIGAIIGGFIMRAVGFAGEGGMIYTILIAILGAVILTWLLRLVTGNRARNL